MTPDSQDIDPLAIQASELLKALAHPARLMICCELRNREMSVGEIETALGIRQPRLSRELAKLRAEGLVETRRAAKLIFYKLREGSRVSQMVQAICAVMLEKPLVAAPASGAPGRPQPGKASGCGVFAQTE